MASIKLGKKEIPLKLTVPAMKNIEKQIGADISKIGEYIQYGSTKVKVTKDENGEEIVKDLNTGKIIKEKTITDKLINIVGIIRHMANGYVAKNNADVDFGIVEGEKLNFYDEELFLNVFSISDFGQLKNVLYETIAEDTTFNVPDDVKLKNSEEVDVVLQEIEAEKSKNE
jgi:hypothetical protein